MSNDATDDTASTPKVAAEGMRRSKKTLRNARTNTPIGLASYTRRSHARRPRSASCTRLTGYTMGVA